ncbi:hypothetical protein GCM10009850_096680 [Nonomuraea monospora]|uniref:RNA polymerase sigma-70 region 2 domain-containing protein n=1 Tax=Nonomuraea monospora TaxID=568818 RepID=A0ABP5PTH5_9ACTN
MASRPGKEGPQVAADDASRTAEDLLTELATPHLPVARRERLREHLVRMHLPLAAAIARRYRGRGEPLDDLLQAACLGLMKAITGFDAGLGHDFRGYAAITMSGEVKRHFRDHTWAVRVPARYQERRSRLNRLIADLSQFHGRSPTVPELAAGMGCPRRRSCSRSMRRRRTALCPWTPPPAAEGRRVPGRRFWPTRTTRWPRCSTDTRSNRSWTPSPPGNAPSCCCAFTAT